jgi:hypothetical protein
MIATAPTIWIPSDRELGFRDLPREAREAAIEIFEGARDSMRQLAKALGGIANFQWSNAGENSLWGLVFQNTPYAQAPLLLASVTAGSYFVSLHTATLSGSSNQNSSEAGYVNYAREGVVRSSGGWTLTGNNPITAENTSAITFPLCGTYGGETETYFAFGQEISGAGVIYGFGALTTPLVVGTGVTPSFASSALTATLT